MKQITKLKMCFSLISMLLSLSCNEELVSEDLSNSKGTKVEISKTEMEKEFGRALAKVLAESTPVRELIKNEALKKIDYDYDVLYLMVKDKKLSSNTTLEELLLKYLDKELLVSIERRMPNLTIFVPMLPENSFSAELWNIDSEIPIVGIRTNETNDVPIFDSNGKESVIEARYIPAYPIVVVKENERIVVNNTLTKSNIDGSSNENTKNSTLMFSFLDDVFDNLSSKDRDEFKLFTKSSSVQSITQEQLKRVYESYDIYANTDGWQRDYVYYGITPSKPQGPFNYNCMECIVGFEMLGDPLVSYNKLSDQTGDPKYTPDQSGGDRSGRYSVSQGWTDGEYEFKIKMYLGKGEELVKYLRLHPYDIFQLGAKGTGGRVTRPYFVLEGIKSKQANVYLPLFEWNLENCGTRIKLSIEEVDSQETIKKTTSMTTEFITSFETTTTTGEKDKVGTKFGNSIRNSTTVTYETTETKGNDELGEFYINFEDTIIFGRDTTIWSGGRSSGMEVKPIYNTKYNTGWCRLYIAPLVVN